MVGGKADWLHLALADLVFAQQTLTWLAFTKPLFTEMAFVPRIISLISFNTFITYYQIFEKLLFMLTNQSKPFSFFIPLCEVCFTYNCK